MITTDVALIMKRIKTARPHSPIAVFVVTCNKTKVRRLESVFGKTVEAEQRKLGLKPVHSSDKCPTCGQHNPEFAEEWIGDFHWQHPVSDVKEFLTKAMEK
jgi:hypothetical protein